MVSVICKVEVLGYHKLEPPKKRQLEELFQLFPVLALSDPIIDKAISLRQLRRMTLGDALIAATALIHNMPLATVNSKDFEWIDQLNVINPISATV